MINNISYSIDKVMGLTCPNKFLVTINNVAVCFANSKKSAKNVVEYAVDFDETRLKNNKIKNKIKRILEKSE